MKKIFSFILIFIFTFNGFSQVSKSKIHNDIYVKKVDTITNLIVWDNVLEQSFPQLPAQSIVLDDTLVDQYKGLDDEAYMHHSTLYRKYGKIYCAYTIHDYDEDASGMYTSLAISDDNGQTWSKQVIMPQMSDMLPYIDDGTGQWSYPALFLDLPSGFYLLINTVGGIINITHYVPNGTAIRKINSNGTLGTIQWINNGRDEDSRIVPTPEPTYPSYSFASESLISEVQTYIKQIEYRPKILFGYPEVWRTQTRWILDNSKMSEPTEIRPYNYTFDTSLHFWKQSVGNYTVVQNTDDESTQKASELPTAPGNPVVRAINYSPEIIIIVSPSTVPTRTELTLAICRKNNETGKYHVANGDVYNISANTKSAPVFPGKNKVGGEQLPFINRVGRYLLDIAFSVSKEEIYFKTIDLSKLI